MRTLMHRVPAMGAIAVIAPIACAPTAAGGQPRGRPSVLPATVTAGRFRGPGAGATTTLIKSRAKALGNTGSPAGTRYWVATDADLARLRGNPTAVLQRLAGPELSADDGVRRVEVLVELHHPTTIRSAAEQSVNIGTTTINGSAPRRGLDVHSSIFASGVTVKPK
jgi:hypothetical protein